MDQGYGNYSLACFKNEINIFSKKRPNKCIDRHENVWSRTILVGVQT